MSRVALVTTELPAFLNAPTAGGGVRIWGLGAGLADRGYEVLYFVVESAIKDCPEAEENAVIAFRPDNLAEMLSKNEVNAAVFEQWQPLTFLTEPLDVPTVVDLPGPLLLEYLWREPEAVNRHIAEKIRCLSLADAFLVATSRQEHYYTPWLLLAGVDLRDQRPLLCPFGLSLLPKCRQGVVVDEPTFFYGGVFWPWQNPTSYLQTVLERMERLRRGQLVIVGGNHPHHEHTSTLDHYRDILDHPHVSFLGALPFSEFVGELRHATVALDLAAPTIERQLACPLRTGVALWSGTPVLVESHSVWADAVAEYKAGWIVQHASDQEFSDTIDAILKESVDTKIRIRGARSLAENKLNARSCVGALDQYLQQPKRREKATPRLDQRTVEREDLIQGLERRNAKLMHEKEKLQHELESIRSKFLFRLYKAVRGLYTAK